MREDVAVVKIIFFFFTSRSTYTRVDTNYDTHESRARPYFERKMRDRAYNGNLMKMRVNFSDKSNVY